MKKEKLKRCLGNIAVIFNIIFIGLTILAKMKKIQQNADEDLISDSYEEKEDPRTIYEKYVKRFLDVIISFFGLVFLAPVYLVIAIAIMVDDPGPILFTQKRVGQNKTYFRLHKFRSMKMSTPHDTPTHMLENPDQYITKVGRFLRKYSLDELPQVWDIFIGNISICGPRPALWNQDDLIDERDKYGANDVKPGLTGWAQVNGRDELEIPVKAKFDGEYAEYLHKSNATGFVMDLKCFFRTIKSVAEAEGVVEGGTGKLKREIIIPIAKCDSTIDFLTQKRILIAGSGSYIGDSFQEYMSQFDNYAIHAFDTREDNWESMDFSQYDIIYDVAEIAHIKETDENRHLYYKVNRDLAFDIAKKAKEEGVRQFIYLSTMSVYGISEGHINEDTHACPINAYGKSKLEAEELLWQLQDSDFNVSIVRPPMVYGKGCKGNYQTLRKFAIRFGMFPHYENGRSMIYIDNLSSAIRGIIHNQKSGLYFPQNVEYICTYEMVKEIADANGKKFLTIPFGKSLIKLATRKMNIFKKVFGTLTYTQSMNVPNSWIADTNNIDTIFNSEQ